MRFVQLLSLAVLGMLLSARPAPADRLVLFAGGAEERDGIPATEALLVQPFSIEFDKPGNAWIVELGGNRLLKVGEAGTLSVVAGKLREKSAGTLPNESGDGGPARDARLNGPHNLVVHPSGDVYIADTWNNRVRRYDPRTGTISNFAGTGKKAYAGDGGPALEADFDGIYCIAFDPKFEKLYVTDLGNRRIRAIDMATGNVELVAGNGMKGVPDDGADAKTAPLFDPRACAADAQGNVYLLERSGHALRVVDSAGKIRTVAGTGQGGNTGDGGDARQATLNGPKHLIVDANGDVIIADSSNHVVRKYSPADGRIVRLAGTGQRGKGPAGRDPLETDLNEPHGVYLDSKGKLYIADSMNDRVLRLEK
ncbi:MAG: hypothetical protein WD066_08825 [Planctomycetaceae bacterium]